MSIPNGIVGNKISPTREVDLFSRGHLGISGSEITATRKLPKWVDFTLQGKPKTSNNEERIVGANLRGKIKCFLGY